MNLGYEGWDYFRVNEIPYKLFKGQLFYRDSIFLERATADGRVRLILDLNRRSQDDQIPGIEEATITENIMNHH